jgi:hypothetical protein
MPLCLLGVVKQVFHESFLRMHPIFGLIPNYTVGMVQNFSTYLFAAVSRQAMHE